MDKLCACCGRRYDAEGWDALRLIGHQVDDVMVLQLRDCVCGSTLAIEVDDVESASAAAEERASAAEYHRELLEDR